MGKLLKSVMVVVMVGMVCVGVYKYGVSKSVADQMPPTTNSIVQLADQMPPTTNVITVMS